MWYFFPPLPQKILNFSRSCKEKSFLQKRTVVKHVSPCGQVTSPFGPAMSLQNYIFFEMSQKRSSAKKGRSFGTYII
jgi:hypothetical protein